MKLMRLIKLRIFFLSLFLPFASSAQTENASLLSAVETNRPVLLIFSGSDWCAPCIHFEKRILSQTAFQSFADDNLTVIKADFPQRKKISNEQKKQNESLADKYNPKGLFPHLVLLNTDGSVMATLSYSHQTPAAFIAEIESYIRPATKHARTNE